jgi:hypothetical protein
MHTTPGSLDSLAVVVPEHVPLSMYVPMYGKPP